MREAELDRLAQRVEPVVEQIRDLLDGLGASDAEKAEMGQLLNNYTAGVFDGIKDILRAHAVL